MASSSSRPSQSFLQRPIPRYVALVMCMVLALAANVRVMTLYIQKDNGLHALPEIRSVNGILTATLEAKPAKIRLGGVTVNGTIYNGEYAGPVLRVHPGDTMKIKLINHATRPMNIHFHGIETSPLDNHDNIHVKVNPGETFNYEINIPTFQPPGLYWYHDHTHGISSQNVMEGLSGLLIVEGFAEQFPEISGIKEQLLVLKDYEFDDSKDPIIGGYYHNNIQSINGKTFSKSPCIPVKLSFGISLTRVPIFIST